MVASDAIAVQVNSSQPTPMSKEPAPAKQGVLNRLVRQISRIWSAFLSLLNCLSCGCFASYLGQKTVVSNKGGAASERDARASSGEKELPPPPAIKERRPLTEEEKNQLEELQYALLDPSYSDDSTEEIHSKIQRFFAQEVAFEISGVEDFIRFLLEQLLEVEDPDRDEFSHLSSILDTLLAHFEGQLGESDLDQILNRLVRRVDEADGENLWSQSGLAIMTRLFSNGVRFKNLSTLADHLIAIVNGESAFRKESLFPLIVSHHSALLKQCKESELLKQIVSRMDYVLFFPGTYSMDPELTMLRACGDAEFYEDIESSLPSFCGPLLFYKEVRTYLERALKGKQIDRERADPDGNLFASLVSLLESYPKNLPTGEPAEEGALPPLTHVAVLLLDHVLKKVTDDELDPLLDIVIEAGHDHENSPRCLDGQQLLEQLLERFKDTDDQAPFREKFSSLVEEAVNGVFYLDDQFSLVETQIRIFQRHRISLKKEVSDRTRKSVLLEGGANKEQLRRLGLLLFP